MEQLAIFGGTPVREQPLGYGKQWIEEDDIQAVAEVLRNGDLTCGPMIAAEIKSMRPSIFCAPLIFYWSKLTISLIYVNYYMSELVLLQIIFRLSSLLLTLFPPQLSVLTSHMRNHSQP